MSLPEILFVEDNDFTRQLVRYWLRDCCRLTLCDHPSEALAVAERQSFDVFLLDINLGRGNNGIDLLNDLRALPTHTHTPAIAFTAYALPSDRERLLDLGFEGYLSKPFKKPDLLGVIETALRHEREPADSLPVPDFTRAETQKKGPAPHRAGPF